MLHKDISSATPKCVFVLYRKIMFLRCWPWPLPTWSWSKPLEPETSSNASPRWTGTSLMRTSLKRVGCFWPTSTSSQGNTTWRESCWRDAYDTTRWRWIHSAAVYISRFLLTIQLKNSESICAWFKAGRMLTNLNWRSKFNCAARVGSGRSRVRAGFGLQFKARADL